MEEQMPHVDITMIPGRDEIAKKEMALKVQTFLAEELGMEKAHVFVSIGIPRREMGSAYAGCRIKSGLSKRMEA